MKKKMKVKNVLDNKKIKITYLKNRNLFLLQSLKEMIKSKK